MLIEDKKRDKKGRPHITEVPLPEDIILALKFRGQGFNWKDSAEKAKTNYKRLREYVKQHPDCKTYQKDIRNTKLEERDNLLIDSAPEAVKTLRDIMRDPRNRAYTRIEAARTILSENRSSVSEVDIKEAIEFQEERINALEGRRIIDVEAE